MDLIIKPTEKCNFKCTFCSSTSITDNSASVLEHDLIFKFLDRYPKTNTIIVNGGDPLVLPPTYYQKIIDFLDDRGMSTSLSFTTNLWPFYKKPEKWLNLFRNKRVGVCTSFQYGSARLKHDLTVFSEADFWKCSDRFLDLVGYRPDFIAVLTEENADTAIKTVELARDMGVVCKLNYAMSSGAQHGKPFLKAHAYEIYLEIWRKGLAPWEWNTQQMMKTLKGDNTSCPLNRSCDTGIRTLQPEGDYYTCGAFGDDRKHGIDFEAEMSGEFFTPLRDSFELQSMKAGCYVCPLFQICNGCKKTISDYKEHGLVERHCQKMKQLAPEIIEANGLTGRVTPTDYVDETTNHPKRKPVIFLQLQV